MKTLTNIFRAYDLGGTIPRRGHSVTCVVPTETPGSGSHNFSPLTEEETTGLKVTGPDW